MSLARDRSILSAGNARTIGGVLLICLLMGLQAGCGPMISVAPTCPEELRIGESGPVEANEVDPGAIPLYEWDVDPTTAGRFANATLNNTTFQALEEGTARLRLRAADGLFQVTAFCEVRVTGAAELAVSLTAAPASPVIGQTVTLTCASIGTTEATTRTIMQTFGPRISITEVSEGVVTLVPLIAGTPVFECVGMTDAGAASEPSELTLNVIDSDDNDDGNDNGNDDDDDNGNDDGGGRR